MIFICKGGLQGTAENEVVDIKMSRYDNEWKYIHLPYPDILSYSDVVFGMNLLSCQPHSPATLYPSSATLVRHFNMHS